RNVGDGIIKLAIETLCAKHGVAATFRDFYGGTPAAPESPGDPFSAPKPQAASLAPRTRPWPQRVWQALLRIALANYSTALLFYATRYRRIAAGYDVARYQQVMIGGGDPHIDNNLNFPLP